MDSTMFYAEDMDLCARLRQAGWSIHYLASATIVHFGGGSTSQGESPGRYRQIGYQSLWVFLLKHHGRAAASLMTLSVGLWSLVTLAILAPAGLVMQEAARSHAPSGGGETSPRRSRPGASPASGSPPPPRGPSGGRQMRIGIDAHGVGGHSLGTGTRPTSGTWSYRSRRSIRTTSTTCSSTIRSRWRGRLAPGPRPPGGAPAQVSVAPASGELAALLAPMAAGPRALSLRSTTLLPGADRRDGARPLLRDPSAVLHETGGGEDEGPGPQELSPGGPDLHRLALRAESDPRPLRHPPDSSWSRRTPAITSGRVRPRPAKITQPLLMRSMWGSSSRARTRRGWWRHSTAWSIELPFRIT